MIDGTIHQVSAAVGALQADVKSLGRIIENLNKTWGERERDAQRDRRELHDKFDTVSKEVTLIAAEVENVSKDLGEIKPAIEVFKSARERQLGAQWMGKLVWMAFIGIAGAVGAAIVQVIRHMRA
jgi:prefoldin subunit 5